MRKIKEKKERALGTKLFLKPERCNGHKCVMIRRPYRPGQHGQKRHRASEFGTQLQEKQKIQVVYGLTNDQLRKLFQKYSGSPEEIVRELETRLDRVVYLLGISGAPRMARQMVSHGHILVNGRKVTVPSYTVAKSDIIEVKPKSLSSKLFEDVKMRLKNHSTPEWLNIDKDKVRGERVGDPKSEAIEPFDINLVGEFYNK